MNIYIFQTQDRKVNPLFKKLKINFGQKTQQIFNLTR